MEPQKPLVFVGTDPLVFFWGFPTSKERTKGFQVYSCTKRCLHAHNSCMCPQVGFGHTYPVRVLQKLSNLPEGVAELLRESLAHGREK